MYNVYIIQKKKVTKVCVCKAVVPGGMIFCQNDVTTRVIMYRCLGNTHGMHANRYQSTYPTLGYIIYMQRIHHTIHVRVAYNLEYILVCNIQHKFIMYTMYIPDISRYTHKQNSSSVQTARTHTHTHTHTHKRTHTHKHTYTHTHTHAHAHTHTYTYTHTYDDSITAAPGNHLYTCMNESCHTYE